MAAAAAMLVLAGCGREMRVLDPDQPLTPPVGPDDPRAPYFTDNYQQVAQGGRYFTWYGCGGCHGSNAQGALDLCDKAWRHGSSFDAVYHMIAERHGSIGQRIPEEQRWQVTAYVLALPTYDPAYRQRQDNDQKGEPQANQWQGPIR